MSKKEIERATSLANAINLGRLDVVRATLRNGISLDVLTQGGCSVLRVAVAKNCAESVRALLDAGADPNMRDQLGYTPLAEVQSVRVARLLIDAGVDLNVECYRRLVPVDLIARKGYIDVLEFLLEAGAEIPRQMRNAEYWQGLSGINEEGLRLVLSHATARSVEAAMPEAGKEWRVASEASGGLVL